MSQRAASSTWLTLRRWFYRRRFEWRERRRLSARVLERELDSLPNTDRARQLRAELADFRRALEASGKRASHLSDAQLSAGVLREARKLRAKRWPGGITELLRETRRRYADSLPDSRPG